MKTPLSTPSAKTPRTRDALRVKSSVRAGAKSEVAYYVRCDRSTT